MKILLALVAVAALLEGSEPERTNKDAVEWNNRAKQLWSQANYPEAEAAFRRALDAWGKSGPEERRGRAVTLSNLGGMLSVMGRYAEAEPMLAESLNAMEAIDGPESLEAARILGSMAVLERSEGNFPKAESNALRAIAIVDRPAVPVAEKDRNRQILASIYLDEHRYEKAEPILRSIVERSDSKLVPNIYNSLMLCAMSRHDYAQAEVLGRQALDSAHEALPAGHPVTAAIHNNLGQLYRFQERYLDAEANYRQAIEIWESSLGPSSPDLAKGLTNLAAFYHERGREAGAEYLYDRALRILDGARGPLQIEALTVRNDLADVLRGERRYSESEKLMRATLPALEKALGPEEPRVTRALANYARLLAETRRQPEAEAILKRIGSQAQGFR